MRLQYRFEDAQGYLIAKVTGNWKLDAASELIDAIAAECTARNCHRVLADCFDIQVVGLVLQFERFVLGQRVGEKLRHVKLAALFPEEQINKFAESIAVEAGAELLVTSDRDEAMRWLAEDTADRASP